MKIAAALLIGFILGVAAMHLPIAADRPSASTGNLAALHGGSQMTQASAAALLMQTDTALCEQPYFIEVYELSVDYFSAHPDSADASEFAELMFSHARNSGHFTAQEAEGWIEHISAIPGQFVDLYKEDPGFLDSCFDFQVASVGPPQ